MIKESEEMRLRSERERTVRGHIRIRFTPIIERFVELPTYHLSDNESILIWKEELESLEYRFCGIMTQLVKHESMEPMKKIAMFPYQKWDDETFELFLKYLYFEFQIVLDKNIGTFSSAPLGELWNTVRTARDPNLGKKLTSRILSYHTFITNNATTTSAIHPCKTMQNISELKLSNNDEMQDFINQLDLKYEHGLFIFSCNQTYEFQYICRSIYAEAYKNWLLNKDSGVPTLSSINELFLRHADYFVADRRFDEQRKRMNKTRNEKRNNNSNSKKTVKDSLESDDD